MTPFDWLQVAIKAGRVSLGEPFGAVITKGNKLVAKATNLVVPNKDPTAHAEIVAIRQACQKLNTHSLTDCVIYSSCEPCPMCLAAILWSGLSELHFAATRKDVAAIGFGYDNLFRVSPKTKWPIPTHSNWRARIDAIKMMNDWRGIP